MALPGELSAFAGSADPGQVESSSQADSKPPGPLAVRPGSKLAAVLQTTLDVLATRVGDEVVARVTGNLKQGGRTVVHQGDRIVGRVTGVRPQSVGKGQKGSEIAIVFDRLQSGANLYRLNATVRSVVSTPGQRRHASNEPNSTQASPQRTQGMRGPHAGTTGGLGSPISHSGAARADKETGRNENYPPASETPSDSLKARFRRAPEDGVRYVSLLTDHQGNLRLSAGTRLDFRTQSQ